MHALEPLGEAAQIVVAIAVRFQFLDRREHVVAVVAGAAVALAHKMQLPGKRQPAGILPVAAVDHVAERVHGLLRVVVEPDRAHGLAIDLGDLLARAQIIDGGAALCGRHPVGDAAAIAAAVEAEHQAGAFRGTAMDEGIDAKRPVGADQAGVAALEVFEAGPPHQRAVGENPQVLAALVDFCAHRGLLWTATNNRNIDRARRLALAYQAACSGATHG